MAIESSAGDVTPSDSRAISLFADRSQLLPKGFLFLLAILAALMLWGLLLAVMPSPLYAALAILGMVGVAVILVSPDIGVYMLVFLLIGQWPWHMITYLGMLTVASYGWQRFRQNKTLLPPSRLLAITGFYLLLVFASAVFAKASGDLRSQILAQVGNFAFVWLFITFINSPQRVNRVIGMIVLSGILTSIIGLIQWRTHFLWIVSTTRYALAANAILYRNTTGFDLQQWGGQFRVDSITGTPDYLPLYLQCLMPFVIFWIALEKSTLRRLAGVCLLALFGLVHLLSFTRGALLTTGLVLFLTGWAIDRKRFIAYAPIVAVMTLAAMLSWGPWRERLATMVSLRSPESGEKENTGMWRLRAIPVGIEMFLERPLLGCGIGQQPLYWPKSAFGTLIPDPKVLDPLPIHNDYLRVAIELGIGGLVAVVLMIVVSISQMAFAAKRWHSLGEYRLSAAAQAVSIAIVGVACAMLLYPITGNFRYFWLLIGMAGGLARLEQETTARRAVP